MQYARILEEKFDGNINSNVKNCGLFFFSFLQIDCSVFMKIRVHDKKIYIDRLSQIDNGSLSLSFIHFVDISEKIIRKLVRDDNTATDKISFLNFDCKI
jgi:hypothetical protein